VVFLDVALLEIQAMLERQAIEKGLFNTFPYCNKLKVSRALVLGFSVCLDHILCTDLMSGSGRVSLLSASLEQ